MLREKSTQTTGLEAHCLEVLSEAFEIIPKTLIQNCGGDIIRTITELRSKHKNEHEHCIDGNTGKVVRVDELFL